MNSTDYSDTSSIFKAPKVLDTQISTQRISNRQKRRTQYYAQLSFDQVSLQIIPCREVKRGLAEIDSANTNRAILRPYLVSSHDLLLPRLRLPRLY
jgi:hypothetical protein